MPLRTDCSADERQNTISFNIRELMAAWEESGEINGDKIRTKKEALRRAIAISTSMCNKKPKKEEE